MLKNKLRVDQLSIKSLPSFEQCVSYDPKGERTLNLGLLGHHFYHY